MSTQFVEINNAGEVGNLIKPTIVSGSGRVVTLIRAGH